MTNTTTPAQPEALRAAAETVKAWSSIDDFWVLPDSYGEVVLGAIDEGHKYPVLMIDADTYGTDGESPKLAQFYAAANPGAVLALLDERDNLAAQVAALRAAQSAELERLRERVSRIGLDIDRALRGEVTEQSPVGTGRLQAIAALAAPAQPAPLPAEGAAFAPPDERDEFEKVFPLPQGCIRVGTGYASTGYSNWAAHTHCERWEGWKARASSAQAPAGVDMRDVYVGAREDLAIWKRRALEAERDLRTERETASRLAAEINAINGPTHLGEPVPTAQPAPAATPSAASTAWNSLRDLTAPLGKDGTKIMEHVRIYAQRQFEAGLAEGLAAPAAQQGDALTQAARDVLAERQRQISVEGWTPEHDDEHSFGEMARAAAAYAAQSLCAEDAELESGPPPWWPWDRKWWKPNSRRGMLVKAGALILAEMERIDRAALAAKGG